MDFIDSRGKSAEQEHKEPSPRPEPIIWPSPPGNEPSLKKVQLLPLSEEPPPPPLHRLGTSHTIIKPPPTLFGDLWGEVEKPPPTTLAPHPSGDTSIDNTILEPPEEPHTHLIPPAQESEAEDLIEPPPEVADADWEVLSEDWPEQATDTFEELSLFDELDHFDIDAALEQQAERLQQQTRKRERTRTHIGPRNERWGGAVSLAHVNWEDEASAEQDALQRLECDKIPMSKETRDFIIQAARNARLPRRTEVHLTTQLTQARQQLAALPPYDEEEDPIDPYAEQRQALQTRIQEIEQTLTTRMQWVAIKKAAHYYKQGLAQDIEFEDLIQFGMEGVIAGIQHYDITRKARLLLAVNVWCMQAIMRARADYGNRIRLPAYIFGQIRRLTRQQQIWELAHGELPTPEELAREMNLPISDIQNVLQLKSFLNSTRIARSIERLKRAEDLNEGYSFRDAEGCLPANNDVLTYMLGETMGRQIAEVIFRELSPRERFIFLHRAGLGEEGAFPTLEELGQQLHVTRERVRQIEERARKKLVILWIKHRGSDSYPSTGNPQEKKEAEDNNRGLGGDENVETKQRDINVNSDNKRKYKRREKQHDSTKSEIQTMTKIDELRQLITEQRQRYYQSRAEASEENQAPDDETQVARNIGLWSDEAFRES